MRILVRFAAHVVVVRPKTVVRWHRNGFRRYWRARKIQAELIKLGIQVSPATVSRYVPKTKPDPSQQQRWMTFLRNHKDAIAGMDFFVVP
jgi:hypothetical protein